MRDMIKFHFLKNPQDAVTGLNGTGARVEK